MSASSTRILHVQSMWTSPYVLSCFVTLRAKKLEFALEPVRLHENAHLEPAFAARSLTARAPRGPASARPRPADHGVDPQ